MPDHIHNGLQASVDTDQPGWSVMHYAAVVGLSRITSEGEVETTVGLYYADGQADYTTEGLLLQGDRLRAGVYEELE